VRVKHFFSLLRKFVAPPVFANDEEKTRQAMLLNTLLVSVLLFLAFVGCIAVPLFFAEKLFNSVAVLVLFVIMGVAFRMMRGGRVRDASILFIFGFWSVFTIFLLFAGGNRSVFIIFYVVGTVIAGLLLGLRGAIIHVVACGLAGLVMAILETSGHPLPRIFPISPMVGWVDLMIALLMTTTVVNLAVRSQNEALILTRQRLEERKQAEQALRRSEEKFRILFETSRDFLYITDLDGTLIEVNKAASDVSGYSLEELNKMNIEALYYDVNERNALRTAILTRGFVENHEIRGRKKDGTIVDALVNSTTIKDNHGNVIGFQGSIKDISGRKHAEEALRESEERFSRLSSVAVEGIGIGEDGKVIDVNARLAEMLGYTEAELIGMGIMDIVAPESREMVKNFIKEGVEGPYEHYVIRKDGSIIPVEVLDKSVPYKGHIAKVTIVRDITERKQAEEALRRSEEKFRTMIEQASEGFALIDENGCIAEWNHAMEAIWGFQREEVLGFPFHEIHLKAVVPERRFLERSEFLRMAMLEAIRTGQSPIFNRVIESELCHSDGKRVFVQQSIFPIKTEHGFRIGSLSLDITARKRAEDNIARQLQRLRTLHNIEQVILSSMDLNKILDHLVHAVVEQLHVDAADVLLFNPQTQKLDFASGEGFRTNALRYTDLELGSGLAGSAAQQKKIIHVARLEIIEDNPTLIKAIAGEGFVTYYGIPLFARNQLHGVMELFHRVALDPDPDWLEFLEALAGQAALSIDNARLLEKNQDSLKETDALYRINQDLVASIEAEKLMSNIVDLLQKNFYYYYVQIFTLDPASGDFIMRAGSGKIGKLMKRREHRLAAGEGIVGFTAETGMPFFSNNVDEVVFFKRDQLLPDVRSELAVQIKTGDQFLGLLDIHQVPPAILSQRDVQLVSAVADQLAVALQKAFLYSDLQEALRQEQAARAQLIHSERLAISGRLLASVSHELNNPLQAIQNALFLLKDESQISLQGQQDLKIVLSETERMAVLLERLRTTYRPFHREDFQPVHVNELIEDVHALMSTHLRHHQITFEFHPDTVLPPISGLSDQLRQVILNLFLNSAEAMTTGGKLSVSSHLMPTDNEIVLKITDTGPGIDPAMLPSIFEAFVTNKEEGTGLGLAIVYEIVTKHGGRVKMANNPEGGATCTIWLPLRNEG
jgi:PAS domain S-box-containing protein